MPDKRKTKNPTLPCGECKIPHTEVWGTSRTPKNPTLPCGECEIPHTEVCGTSGIQRSVFLRTFGCQMNVRDAEALASRFLEAGYTRADHWEAADVILVVTCSVRQGAEDRAVSFVRSLSGLKRGGRPIIGFLGCAAKNRGEEIRATMPHVDIIAAPSELDRVFDLVEKKQEARSKTQEGLVLADDRARDESFYSTFHADEPDHAQVVISTGCNNWCSYCIVPYVRGELRHREPDDIVSEVREHVARGRHRITLLGQNVNDYPDFIDLLKSVAAVPGVGEIDFTSSHPKNQSPELFKVMAALPNVKKHLHMAMQSGSTKILSAMNRGYTKERLLDIIAEYKRITGGTIGTDIIVGFPGETDEDFSETFDVVKRARFNYAFIFMYSPRPHSKAFDWLDDVPEEVKKQRHAQLLELQKQISHEINRV
jgi:tRNA-2-methylthio-N6-dimethylallyladenosine synthase